MNANPSRVPMFLAGFTALLVVGGCGSSGPASGVAGSKSKGPRQDPGFVRVVNLSGTPINVFDRGRALVGEIQPDQSSKMIPVGVGTKPIEIGEGKGSTVQVPLKSQKGTTVLVFAGGKTAFIEDEQRYSSADANVRVEVVDSKGNPVPSAPVQIVGPLGPLKLKSGTHILAASGSYKTDGEQFAVPASADLDPKLGYTFLFVESGGKLKPFFLKNGDNDKPVVGASGAT